MIAQLILLHTLSVIRPDFEVVKEGQFLHFDSGFFVLSLFVQRKNQRKGAGKDNLSLFVRLLRKPLPATKQSEVRTFSGLPTPF
jgi:hypothetical protein